MPLNFSSPHNHMSLDKAIVFYLWYNDMQFSHVLKKTTTTAPAGRFQWTNNQSAVSISHLPPIKMEQMLQAG